MEKILLQGGDIITEKGQCIKGCDLLVVDGRIAAIEQALSGDGCEIIDCKDRYITPGFAVLHAHSPMHILRGLAEDVHIDDWFNAEIFPYESKLTRDDIYWGARQCMAEMLDNGVTAFADHYFGADIVADAVLASGIRCDIAVTAFAMGGDATEEIAKTRSLLEQFKGSDRVQIRYGPHSPYLCTPEALAQLTHAAREDGVGVHLHLSETSEQVRQSYLSYGKSPFVVAAQAGCFDQPCIVAHGLWIEENDLPLLSDDTYIAVCPKTYLKLGMGLGKLWQLHSRLNLCIGTDGAASSNTVNPLEQLMLFGLLGKCDNRAEEYSRIQLWQMLMNGHNALGFDSGRITEGAAADLNVWNLDSPATSPAYNPLTSIIYSACPRKDITHTLVGGRFVKRDGKLVQDMAELSRGVSRSAKAILARGKGDTDISF